METKEIVDKLRYVANYLPCYGESDTVKLAADRLEAMDAQIYQHRAEIAELKKQLSEKQSEWISVEDGKEMPDSFSYTGIYHSQFPRLVVAIDENSHATHWMMLDAPKPKEPTFKDVFLKAFPKATILNPAVTIDCCAVFPWLLDEKGCCQMDMTCAECWNQPYFEEEEKE